MQQPDVVMRDALQLFVWDHALKERLERAAPAMPSHERGKLAAIAKENYGLCRKGGYMDAHHRLHSLKLPPKASNVTIRAPPPGGQPLEPRFHQTRVCIACIDTASAARTMLDAGTPAATLNFANAYHVGGGYLNGAKAQEEDLCRLMPGLYSSLKELKYPLPENAAHYTHAWLARAAGTYELVGPPVPVAVISAAMPNLKARQLKQLKESSPEWEKTVRLRIRAVLHTARENGHDNVLLGAFGCGAFGNPPKRVAAVFADVLSSAEFLGAFHHGEREREGERRRDGADPLPLPARTLPFPPRSGLRDPRAEEHRRGQHQRLP